MNNLFDEAIDQTHILLKTEVFDEQFDSINDKSNNGLIINQNLMQFDDDNISSSAFQDKVSASHLIKLISYRISSENVTLTFIPDFDK